MRNPTIYVSSAGTKSPGACGWSFVAIQEGGGDSFVFQSGSTNATQRTALAMGLLQALHWVSANHYKAVIKCRYPEVAHSSMLAARIADVISDNKVVRFEGKNINMELADMLSNNMMLKMQVDSVSFDEIEIGKSVIKRLGLFSQSYDVVMKFEGTKTVVLRNMTTTNKKVEVLSKKQFEQGNFIVV